MAPARDPPMWDCCDAQAGEETQIGPDWDLEAQPAPDEHFDLRPKGIIQMLDLLRPV
jgi:hypothetical protein